MIRRLAVGGARATVVAAGGGASYAAYKYQTDEGSRRAMTVYASFIPVVLHYRFVQTKHRVWPVSEEVASSEWRDLDQRYAVPTVAKLAELQGMYTKYGQKRRSRRHTSRGECERRNEECKSHGCRRFIHSDRKIISPSQEL